MSINHVILIGNIGSEVNLRNFPDGRPFGSVSLATTEHWRDQEGNKNKHTEWHRLSFFGRQAEIANEYLKKGSKIYVEGQLRTRKWQDREGQERSLTEIRVAKFLMLDSRGATPDGETKERSYDSAKSDKDAEPRSPSAQTEDSFGDMGEDIPW